MPTRLIYEAICEECDTVRTGEFRTLSQDWRFEGTVITPRLGAFLLDMPADELDEKYLCSEPCVRAWLRKHAPGSNVMFTRYSGGTVTIDTPGAKPKLPRWGWRRRWRDL